MYSHPRLKLDDTYECGSDYDTFLLPLHKQMVCLPRIQIRRYNTTYSTYEYRSDYDTIYIPTTQVNH